MARQDRIPGLWARLPISARAIVSGLLIALVAANVWPLLLLSLGVPLAAVAEVIFLVPYLWWTRGGGSPRSTQIVRASASRSGRLSGEQWFWGVVAAVFFAVTVHSAIVLLFRFVPFPIAAFRRGYDFSFIPSPGLKWVAVVISAMSAGICEETGFRGYMQRPIEQRHGVFVAILISSVLFTVVHLTKGWAMIGMVPIVFGAGVLLGLLAWASGSLIPCMIGHVLMDVGLFAYWWTGVAGDFTALTVGETGWDTACFIACTVFVVSLGMALFSISRLRRRALAAA
jgi:membrane protease YdiL (CAAX protease family)